MSLPKALTLFSTQALTLSLTNALTLLPTQALTLSLTKALKLLTTQALTLPNYRSQTTPISGPDTDPITVTDCP